MRSLARALPRDRASRARSPAAAARRRRAPRPRASAGSSAAASAWRVEASACSPVRSATTRTARSLACSASASSALAATQRRWNKRRLGLAHLRRHGAVADRLARLLLERVHLRGELADHVFQPQQILLGRAQPQLRLVAARMQAGNAGGLFEHAAALLGLGLDDLADAALVHQRRRARAGRGVGEQDLHVAGAHLAAVDAVGRACSRSMRRDTSSVSWSLNCGRRLALGIVDGIATSALLRAGRVLVPEKITSSMSAARIALCELSPITQRSASTRFDLPQPFGPTTPVSPGSIRKSVGSTKDLKPSRRSRVSFILHASSTKRDERPLARWVLQWTVEQSGQGLGPGPWFVCRMGRENESSRALEQQSCEQLGWFSRPFESRQAELWR